MKISNKQLTKMVNEEIQQMVDEGFFGKMGHKMGFETGETERIDRVLMQVARALEETTGEYGLDLTYEDDPVQAVSDFVDRIGGMFMKAGLPKADMAKAKELMMQGKGQEGADIMYNHFLGMRRTPKGDEARTIISQKLRDIGSKIADAEDVLRTKASNARNKARRAEFEKEQAAADKSSWWGNRKRKADGPRWTGDRKEKTPHGRATSAVGSSNLAYGEGKVTKAGLRKFINEVRENMAGEGEEQPGEEAAPGAGALDSGAAGKEKSDVKTALQYIQKVDNRGEYGQMAQAVVDHGANIAGGKAVLTRLYKILPKIIGGMQESKLTEDDVQTAPGGNWGQAIPGAGSHEYTPGSVEELANQIMDLMAEANLSHNDAVDVLNHLAIEMGLNEPEESNPIGFRENLRQALIKESLKRALAATVRK